MKFRFSALLLLPFCSSLFAQSDPVGEHLVPLSVNPVQQAEALNRANQRSIGISTASVVLPSQGLRDNFAYDSHRPDTTMWDQAFPSGVFINRTWAISPPDLGVCTFDGLNEYGNPYNDLAGNTSTAKSDSLVSRSLDLSALSPADSVYLSFWYQPQGRGYAPNTQDSLLLYINIPSWNIGFNTIWKEVWFKEGYVPASSDSGFHIAMFKLDSSSYYVDGFRFMFRNYATQSGSNDHWHIDDVYIKKQRTIADTISQHVDFVYPASSALTDFWSVPNTHYKPTMMASNFNVNVVNRDEIAGTRSLTYWYDVQDESSSQLTLYPNVTGSTIPCPTYSASGYLNYAPISAASISAWNYPQLAINADTTTFRIRHILHSSTDIDTMVQLQKFYNYYAYDDGTAEVGYGLIGSYSSLAYEFSMPIGVSDTLKAVQMYFLPVKDLNQNVLLLREFQLTVWDDLNGSPNNVIYRQRNQHIQTSFETPDRFVTYTLDSGTVALTSGQKYYVGWVQASADILYLGFDFNTDHHDKIHYNTTGNWNTSIFEGSLMMRPVFGEVYGHTFDNTGITENNSEGNFNLYPNPSSSQINISGLNEDETYIAQLMDLSGRKIASEKFYGAIHTIEISEFSEGLYFVQIVNGDGVVVGTKRIVVSR